MVGWSQRATTLAENPSFVCPPPWAVEILRPFLTDTQEPPWRYGMEGELRLRVFDRAAMTLSRLVPGLKFTTPARFEDRDREIAAIQAALARRDR